MLKALYLEAALTFVRFAAKLLYTPVTNREYRLKGPYAVLSFLPLLFCVLCVVIVNSVLKSRFSIISAPGLRKRQKQRRNMVVQFAGLKIIILRAVIQS